MAKAFGADPVHMNVALTSYLLSPGGVHSRPAAGSPTASARARCSAPRSPCSPSARSCAGGPTAWRSWSSRASCKGIGGAMMVPVGRLVLLRTAAKQELVAAMAWLTVPALLGPGAGPAGRRFHRHLFLLALDLRHQRADRHPGHRAGQPVRRGRARAAARPVRRDRPAAVRHRARRPDVRAGDRRPRRGAARPRPRR